MSEPTQGHDDAQDNGSPAPDPAHRPPLPQHDPFAPPAAQQDEPEQPQQAAPGSSPWTPPATTPPQVQQQGSQQPVPPQAGQQQPGPYSYPQGQPQASPQQPYGQPYGNGPYQAPQNGYPVAYPQQQQPKPGNKGLVIGGAIVGGIVVVLLVIWLVNLVVGGMTPKASPDEPSGASQSSQASSSAKSTDAPSGSQTISALDAKKGQCFWNYPDDSNSELVVVDCGAAHSGQLVNVYYYPDTAAFPGVDQFKTKGRELCRTASLTDEADSLELRQRFAYPSQDSWKAGDRRVDCIVFTEDGNTLTKSLAK
ncbi:septum formation family protein [Arthrobacter sp. NPDC090010]|uniref:septum formation family protein n=1 Tax=Arthrobacter sp. NPDC090010 TaxID=3363942 RepID=UPI0037F24E01